MSRAWLAFLLLAAPAQAQTTRALIVAGVAGDPALARQFEQDAATLRTALVQRFGAETSLLTESSTPRSDKAALAAAVNRLAAASASGDRVLIVLMGHGSAQNGAARFNIPGPDVTAAELAHMLAALRGRNVALVLATSASGAFLGDLAAPGRSIISATRSGSENEAVVFPRFLAQALAQDVADTDKDGGVSLLEAFEYAKGEVARYYQTEKRLATEHAQLSDTTAAAAFVLRAGSTSVGNARVAALNRQIEALKARKANMPVDEYEAGLEKLLLELTRVRRETRGNE